MRTRNIQYKILTLNAILTDRVSYVHFFAWIFVTWCLQGVIQTQSQKDVTYTPDMGKIWFKSKMSQEKFAPYHIKDLLQIEKFVSNRKICFRYSIISFGLRPLCGIL